METTDSFCFHIQPIALAFLECKRKIIFLLTCPQNKVQSDLAQFTLGSCCIIPCICAVGLVALHFLSVTTFILNTLILFSICFRFLSQHTCKCYTLTHMNPCQMIHLSVFILSHTWKPLAHNSPFFCFDVSGAQKLPPVFLVLPAAQVVLRCGDLGCHSADYLLYCYAFPSAGSGAHSDVLQVPCLFA